ncbi:MAG: M23 family metallopeptidase [Bacilli bacterium]|nr:M23 family metallopeptidase [Bacilli bacterium]
MIDTSKYLNKINGTNNKPKKFNYRKYINRILFLIVLFLINLIIMKKSTTYKDFIYNKVYNNNFSFAKIKEFYNKYLGGVDSLNKVVKNTTPVFNETLTYKSKSKYLDGVKLEVSTNYLVPIIKEGLVVFLGEKEGYGNVIIIQGVDDINIWYGNMSNTSVKLYDYVEKGSLLGEVSNNTLYLVYEKDGKFLDIEEY